MTGPLRLVVSQNLNAASPNTNPRLRRSVKSPNGLSKLPPLAKKAARLARTRPNVATVLEALIDDLLAG